MRNMIEKKFFSDKLEIVLSSFIDNKQNVWFKGKDVAQILGYRDTKKAIKQHVSEENKIIQLISSKAGGYVSPPPPPRSNKMKPRAKKLAWTFRPLRSNKVDGTH